MKVENVPTHHETMKNDGGTIFRSSMIPIFFSLYYFLNKLCVCACTYSQIQLVVTPWTAARQASLSLGFPRQEHWSGLPFPSPTCAYANVFMSYPMTTPSTILHTL